MSENKKSATRQPSWRTLPCPACGKKNFMKDFINGYPAGEIDDTRHIYGGCLPEYWSKAEIACGNCDWGGSKEDLRSATRPFAKLTERFIEAFAYANFQHRKQARKSTNIAYISHPMGVAGLIIEAGGDEDLAIAGLLHDVPEDCGGEPRLTEIKEKFGSRVEQIVRACSDALPADGEEKADWRFRKEQHINALRKASDDVLLVIAADKTHNARAIANDLGTLGTGVWERFNASSEEIIWYYEQVFELLEIRNITPKLLTPLRSAIEVMRFEPGVYPR